MVERSVPEDNTMGKTNSIQAVILSMQREFESHLIIH